MNDYPPRLTLISCEIAATVASIARVPRVCSSSTALTVLSNDDTFNTITFERKQIQLDKFRLI